MITGIAARITDTWPNERSACESVCCDKHYNTCAKKRPDETEFFSAKDAVLA